MVERVIKPPQVGCTSWMQLLFKISMLVVDLVTPMVSGARSTDPRVPFKSVAANKSSLSEMEKKGKPLWPEV